MMGLGASKKLQLAVLFGGRSVEHEISVITALQLMKALDTQRYSIIPVYISPQGRWYTSPELRRREVYRGFPRGINNLKEVVLLPFPSSGGLTVVERGRWGRLKQCWSGEEKISVDLFLPAFHGEFGEDGCLQGLFEMADVAYVGPGVAASAISMNKAFCKDVFKANGIDVLPHHVVSKVEVVKSLAVVRADILANPALGEFPLFVKPCHLGSSIGISKASNPEELDAALALVFRHDTHAIIEPSLEDMFEMNVSVMAGDPPRASVVEVPYSESGVLSFEDKYLREGKGKKGGAKRSEGMASLTRAIDPKDLDQKVKDTVIAAALKGFKLLDCGGVGRFDFMHDNKTGRIYFNELNPQPGSFSFYLWIKSHPPVLYTDLLDGIIEAALARRRQQASLQRELEFRAL